MVIGFANDCQELRHRKAGNASVRHMRVLAETVSFSDAWTVCSAYHVEYALAPPGVFSRCGRPRACEQPTRLSDISEMTNTRPDSFMA